MKKPKYKPTVKTTKNNSIIGKIKRVLRAAGADQEYINQYLQESMSVDRGDLLRVATKYVYIK